MVDQFGNTEHVIVVDVGYSRAILDPNQLERHKQGKHLHYC